MPRAADPAYLEVLARARKAMATYSANNTGSAP